MVKNNKQAKTAARQIAADTGISYTAARRLDSLVKVTTKLPTAGVNPQINWDHVTRAQFDEIVEALVDRLYDAPGNDVEIVNGRGGDRGRDIFVREGERTLVFQLKYFLGGFPASNRSRRRQITDSFNRAMLDGPDEWILVVPTTVTPPERTFVTELGAAYPNVKIRIWDRARLNNRLAGFPDLVALFTRDNLREAAVIFGQEKAMLSGGMPDLADRVQALSRMADTLDPHWTVDIAAEHGVVRQTLRAKHRYAAQRSPIGLTITGTFGPGHEELARAARRSLGFGVAEPLRLPPEIVEELTVTGPAWLAGSDRGVEVTWVPVRQIPETPIAACVRLLDENGQTMSSHQGTILHAGSGDLGSSLEMDFYRQATVTLLFGSGEGAEMTGNFKFTDAAPVIVQQTARLYRDIHTCSAVEVELDGAVIGRIHCTPNTTDDPTARGLAATELLADDLSIVQQHCSTYFPVPADLPVDDRIAIRVARLLVEGHCVVYPRANTYTTTLNGLFDDAMRAVLAVDGPVPITIQADFTLEVAGHKLRLGRIQLFHTQTEIRDRSELLTALQAGRGADRKMVLAPINGQSFRAFLPQARVGREDEPLHVTGWGLPGLDGPTRG